MSSQAYIFNPTERTSAASGDGFSAPRLTTTDRNALSLGVNGKGMMVYDTTLTTLCIWNGTAWEFVSDNSNGWVSVKDFGAKGDGVTDDTAAINAAIASATSGGIILFPNGTYLVTSQIVVTAKVKFVGFGIATENGIGALFRGPSCILRGFAGANATVAFNSESSGADQIDFDGNLQGTGDQVQVWGSRAQFGAISTRNSGGNGVRIGKTDAGPSTINANFWSIQYLVTCGNNANGIRIDDTNTTTSFNFPLGAPNANAGIAVLIDSRSNVGDGVQVGNANDNTFANIGSQSNTGIGIHFITDGTNSGPRCNTVLSNDSEANIGNDIQLDASTLPASNPGGYNKIYGNRSAALNSRIVNNSTGSLVIQWNPNMLSGGYATPTVNAYNPSGVATFDGYAGANAAVARFIARASGATGSLWEVWTKANAGLLALRAYWEADGTYIHNPTGGANGLGILISKTTGDTVTPGIQLGDVGAGGFYTRINMVGSGAVADTKFAFYNSTGQTGSIVTTGAATAYNIASDYRLKENAVPVDGSKCLESVMSWPIYQFNWKWNGQSDIGTVAHELQAVKPTAVSGDKDAMRNGDIDPQGVDYSKLVPELVAAVQFLAKKVAVLESK